MYDAIVVGAGVAGCSIAHSLYQRGLNVLILDQASSVANGGSGAAGAFVSPKIGKASPLQELTNTAFDYAVKFYQENFPQHFHQTGVIRIPKDAKDNAKFPLYREHSYPNFEDIDSHAIAQIGIDSEFDGFLFPTAGVCDSKALCQALIESIPFQSVAVETIEYIDGIWTINRQFQTKKLILATGYKDNLIDLSYMGIRATWGSRGDFKSTLPITQSIHKDLSISKNFDGVIKIGATHNKAYSPCLNCHNEPLKPLLDKASKLIDISQLELKEVFCGMRSGSHDYFPLVGGVVDVEYMFQHHPKIKQGAKVPLKMINNLYIINGLGGRGFVFAPLMAKMLADNIVENTPLDSRIDPNRLFLKWCRKL